MARMLSRICVLFVLLVLLMSTVLEAKKDKKEKRRKKQSSSNDLGTYSIFAELKTFSQSVIFPPNVTIYRLIPLHLKTAVCLYVNAFILVFVHSHTHTHALMQACTHTRMQAHTRAHVHAHIACMHS